MNETPEVSPPAFPSSGPAEDGRAPEGAAGRAPLADPRGLPKLSAAWPASIAKGWQAARAGTWRVAVAEESMAPALLAGDWLLLDPTCDRWPRRGSVVVFHEPGTGILAIKRVAAHPGDRVRISAGILHLASDEAWLLGDNGALSLDSRRYGPVPLEALVGRAWFRYGPIGRIGSIARKPVRPDR
jgi:signal peptidase I